MINAKKLLQGFKIILIKDKMLSELKIYLILMDYLKN